MSDLIERHVAIDALKNEQSHYSHEDGVEIFYEYNHAIKALKNLPSAQPEIIRCKDCRKWNERLPKCDKTGKLGYGVNDFCSKAERKTDA